MTEERRGEGKMETTTVGTRERRRQRPRGTGSLYLVGRFWYVEYSDRPGHRVQESSRSTKKSVAEQLLKKRLMEIGEGRFTSQTRRLQDVTFGELCGALLDDYRVYRRKTLRETEGRLKLHLLPFFGAMRAVDIGTDRILAYMRKRQEEGAADGSIQLELAGMKRAFRLAAESTPPRVLRVPHIPSLRLDNVRTGFVEQEQYRRLRDELPGHVKPIAGMGYHTGMRLGEICALRWEQIDWLNHELRLNPGETKNEEGRTIPLVSELFELLRLHRAGSKGSAFVFPSPRRPDRPITDFRKAWEDACVRAGLGRMESREGGRPRYVGLTFHDLRRSAIMNFERAGVPRSVAMKISGHRTESTYRRYAIVSPRDLRDAASRLEKYLGAERPAAPSESNGEEAGRDEPTN